MDVLWSSDGSAERSSVTTLEKITLSVKPWTQTARCTIDQRFSRNSGAA